MNVSMRQISEKIASDYALEFLKEYAGSEIFIGGEIEQILGERGKVVYQDVKDPKYFGAAIYMQNTHIIAINTNQPLRSRYYSAAHELWHLQYESDKITLAQISDFDHERAADHFAASLMLPEPLVANLINKNDGDIERLVFKIADLSSMPYVAVVRRLRELKKRIPKDLLDKNEDDWVKFREELGLPQSPLDKSDNFRQFTALVSEVEEQLAANEITLEVAANLLRHIDPEKAENYWKKRQEQVTAWLDDDD